MTTGYANVNLQENREDRRKISVAMSRKLKTTGRQ